MKISGSIYLTLSIAVERYATVCHPYFRVNLISNFIFKFKYLNCNTYTFLDPEHVALLVLSSTNSNIHCFVQSAKILGTEGN